MKYYEIHRDPTSLSPSFISGTLQTGNGPLTIVAHSNFQVIPNTTVYDEMQTIDASSSIGMGLCPSSSGYFIGVVGTAANSTDLYHFQVDEYDGLININSPVIQNTPHNGNKYFVTQAYKDVSDDRRVVIRADDAFTTLFELAENCDFTQGYIGGQQISDKVACIQLGDDEGNKYIRVGPMTINYGIVTENGKCADAGAFHLKASFLLIFICILAFI